MDRRTFLKDAVASAAALDSALPAAFAPGKQYVLANKFLAWHLETYPGGVRGTAFENKLSGRRVRLTADREFTLVFSAAKERHEIPWWHSRTSAQDAPPTGLHEPGASGDGWHKAQNLRGTGGGRVYQGYGWYRHDFTLGPHAEGQEIAFVLGGYDQQDWNDYQVFLNGTEIGRRASSGRWRSPGEFSLRPTDPAYSLLRFGAARQNAVSLRTHQYDLHFEGISDKALERYVFRPYLFDQFISVGRPYLRLSEFELVSVKQSGAEKISFELRNAEHRVSVTLHYELHDFVRRKWLEIRNEGDEAKLLLDVELDDFQMDGDVSDGGHGEPVFCGDDAFFAIAHPAGVNQGQKNKVKLWHAPGRHLAPGTSTHSYTSLAAAASPGEALDQFHAYLRRESPRKNKAASIFTVFGTNNQWGACPSLSDSEVLDVHQVLKGWQEKGLRFDYFTIDSGWPDNSGDLKAFSPTCYPDGPGGMVESTRGLGMDFGLWFSVSWGGWSCGSYPPVQPSTIPDAGNQGDPPTDPPVGIYRNGYPTSGGIGRQLCIASDPYFRVFRDAVDYHVQHNHARLIKFDSGNYYCNSTAHEHLPGKYSTEAMFDRLIDIANSARKISPDVIVIWYWGLSSPFWALHGDVIFESGLFMEGSGTSWYPTLHYRDSVTLSLDQNTQFAKLIPAVNKDSLGVWLSQIRWGNFMGKERWREAVVMDLGRGNLLFPQIWGDPYLLNEQDVRFLAEISDLARKNLQAFTAPRRTFGDSWKNEPYGYSFFDGAHGFVFLNNVHFSSRPVRLALGPAIGLKAARGTPLEVTSHFPERSLIAPESGTHFRTGDTVEFWLRPFEVRMLEFRPPTESAAGMPRRALSAKETGRHGFALALKPRDPAPWMDLRFADSAKLEKQGLGKSVRSFSTRLPELPAGRSILAIPVMLRKGEAEFRYAPFVAQLVQLRVRIDGRDIQLIPVPDARQFGNTQSAGSSWVVYKVPLSPKHSQKEVEFAVHTYLPSGVEPQIEAWVIRQWWQEMTRPQADGFYGDAPS
jgi:hypothetical protein